MSCGFCLEVRTTNTNQCREQVGLRVKRGATLYGISKEFGVPVKKLMSDNGIKDPRKLRAGQELKIGDTKPCSASFKVPVSEEAYLSHLLFQLRGNLMEIIHNLS
ncbi:hypothetical protein A2438_01600 [candidate division WOR-1 bacterium RIFOXYC2_FULL_46_14]|uniref:LysM domain-containing protein n=1 Tax=candidate division WOR-1 bacterium RIFOXYC2_FULL_46_14 TaxID=1802587 RepID=A0A1F4U7N1_UNCSA|nr:MAG: hypothetical protein A2438_01600 [candidate division WOR-1 bacterium RIFOXYC2_FULL_46_14]